VASGRAGADPLSRCKALAIAEDVRVPAEEHERCDVVRRIGVLQGELIAGLSVPDYLPVTREWKADRQSEFTERIVRGSHQITSRHVVLLG